MAVTADSVIVELEARTAGFTTNVRQAGAAMEQAATTIERGATRAETAVRSTTNVVQISAAAQANATRNFGRQIADVGASLSSGASPFQVLAQQAPQFADALAGTQGVAGRLASFFAGPWGAALLAAGSVLGIFIEKLFSASKAQKDLQRSAEAAAEAQRLLQDVLGGTIQSSERARIAALDQALALEQVAQKALNAAEAQLRLAEAYQTAKNAEATGGRALNFGAAGVAANADERVRRQRIEVQTARGQLAAQRIQLQNLRRLADTARGIEQREKDEKAAREAAADRRRSEAEARRAAREVEREAKEEARRRRGFANDLARSQSELLAAEADLTADTRLQDEVLRRRIVNERDRAKNDIDENPNYDAAQRERLKALQDEIADAKLRRVNIVEAERFLREELAIRQNGIENERELLRSQQGLAETNAERRDVALRIIDLAYQQERAELEAVLASKQATDAQKRIAEERLAILDQLQQNEEERARRDTESPGAAYRRRLREDAQNVNDAVEQIQIRGLESLNDGLVDAIMGVRSLGDVFKNVANQIIADLLRIAVQRSIIEPLANALFPGSGGGGGGGFSLGSVLFPGGGFGGGRASGGFVSAGQLYRVNEGASPGRVEGFRPLGSGTIIPLGQMNAARQASQIVVQQTVNVDARNSVNPDGFERRILSISAQQAQQAGETAYRQSLRDAPTTVSRAQRFGTTR